MAGMVGLFSTIGEHMPIFREDKLVEATPESWVIINNHLQFDESTISTFKVNKLHYRITCMLLLVAVMLVTCTEWISGAFIPWASTTICQAQKWRVSKPVTRCLKCIAILALLYLHNCYTFVTTCVKHQSQYKVKPI